MTVVKALPVRSPSVAAVEQERFYIFPHPKIKSLIEARAQAASIGRFAFDPRSPLRS